MSISAHQFRIQALPTIVMGVLVPLFLGLGIWQLERADQKRSLAASLEMRRKLPPMPLTADLPDAGELEFRKVTATGRLLGDRTVLIENRKHQGKSGFHVITPLALDDARIVLVNRGWVSGQEQASAAPDASAAGGTLVIEGEVNIPQPPALKLDLKITQAEALPQWPYLTLENYAAWSGLDILPFLILQAADDSSGFIRRWPQPRVNDAMHTGYAVQWFAFALIALLIWLRLCIHRTTGGGTER
ncbi:MAG: SURF1 family protein [Pseudomonadota bacterium]